MKQHRLHAKHDEMAAAMIAAAESRPARKRKSVNHYSDDNPSTFTVKKRKRGEQQPEVDDDHDDHDEPAASPSSLPEKNKARGKGKAAVARSSPPAESTVFQDAELPDSRNGRRRRRPHWLAGGATSSHSTTATTAATTTSSPLLPLTTTSSSTRRKDPPTLTSAAAAASSSSSFSSSRRKDPPSAAAASSRKPAPTTTTTTTAPQPLQQQQQQQQRVPGGGGGVRFLPVVDEDERDEIREVTLAHAVAVCPILKVSLPEADDDDSAGVLLSQRYENRCVYKSESSMRHHRPATSASSTSVSTSSSSLGATAAASAQPPPPLARQGLSMTTSGAAAAAAPVTSEILGAPPVPTWKCCKLASEQRHVKGPNDKMLTLPPACLTCFAVRSDDPSYWLAGDAAGCLLLYCSRTTSSSSSRPIQVVETLASAREALRTLLSKTVIDYPNVIYKAAWRGDIVVAWTEQEVQAINVVTHTTLFCLPLVPALHHQHQQAQPALQSLELHPRSSIKKCLWRPAHGRRPVDEHRHVSLYLIDYSNPEQVSCSIIHPDDVVDPESFHVHAMVWEAASSCPKNDNSTINNRNSSSNIDSSDDNDNNDRVLMVAQYDDTLQLLRFHVSTGHLLQRVDLPKPPGMVSNTNNNSSESSLAATSASGNNNNNNSASASVASALPRHYFTDSVISLYDEYFFLCTGRGIRCYETSSLTFLSTYGESVALHGKTLGWQACFWIPEPHYDKSDLVVHAKKQQVWLERGDELSSRHDAAISISTAMAKKKKKKSRDVKASNTTDSTTTNGNVTNYNNNGYVNDDDGVPKLFSNMLLVGVPHPTRGPQELQSTLYVWKPGQVLPLQTVQAPMGGGLLGLHIYAPPKRSPTTATIQQQQVDSNNVIDARILTLGWRMVCATQELGQAWEWQATMQSNFAGTMYPVGYQIIDDNVEYIEDEDELDIAVYKEEEEEEEVGDDDEMTENVKGGKKAGNHDASLSPSMEDPDLQEALRRSMMDATPRTLAAVSNTICVLNDDDDDDAEHYEDKIWIPSRPDPSLRRVFEKEQPAQSASSPGRGVGKGNDPDSNFAHHDFLSLLPQVKHVVKQSRLAAAATAVLTSSALTTLPSSLLPLKRQDSYSSTSSLGRTTPAPSPPTVPTIATDATITTATTAVAAAATAISTAAPVPPPKVKGKRTRTANVEALLQSSIDPVLRHKMGMIHKRWASGQGSRLILSSHASTKDEIIAKDDDGDDVTMTTENGNSEMAITVNHPIQQQFREDEEKELAMELLLLSPSSAAKHNHTSTSWSGHVDDVMSDAANPSSEQVRPNDMTEKSEPLQAPVVSVEISATNADTGPYGDTTAAVTTQETMICAACHGRMVMHRCGKRDQPVDFEALARAEKEREAEEEAERQRLKVEKRRAAEAKRRETRRKNKELEELKRREEEEERLRQLEAERLAQANIQEAMEESEGEEEEEEQQVAVMDTSVHSTGANSQHHGDNDTWTQSVFQPAFSPLAGASNTGVSCGTRLAIPKFSEIAAAEHQAAASSPAAAHAFTTATAGTNLLMEPPQPMLTSEPLSKFYARQESLLSDHSSGYSSSGHPLWPATTTTTTNSKYSTTDDTSHKYASSGHPAWPATTLPVEDANHIRYVSTGRPAWPSTTSTATELYMTGFSSNGDDLQPSRTISASDGDALAALAGLANIMPVATENDYNTTSEGHSGGWSNNNSGRLLQPLTEQDPSPPTIPNLQQQHVGSNYDYSPSTTNADRRGSGGSYDYAHGGSYDYAGSADRRSAIHAALTSQYASEERGIAFGDDGGGGMQPSSSSFAGDRDSSSNPNGQAAHNFSSSLSGSHAFLAGSNDTNNNNNNTTNNTGEFYHRQSSASTSRLGNGNCDVDGSNHSGSAQNSYLTYGSTAVAAGAAFGSNNNNGNAEHTATTSFYSSSATTAAAGHDNVGTGIGSAAGVPPHPTKTSN